MIGFPSSPKYVLELIHRCIDLCEIWRIHFLTSVQPGAQPFLIFGYKSCFLIATIINIYFSTVCYWFSIFAGSVLFCFTKISSTKLSYPPVCVLFTFLREEKHWTVLELLYVFFLWIIAKWSKCLSVVYAKLCLNEYRYTFVNHKC